MFKQISIFIIIIILFNCGKNKIVNSEDETIQQQQTSMNLLEVYRTTSNQMHDTLLIPDGAVWIGYVLWKYDNGVFGIWNITPTIHEDTLFIGFNSNVSFEYKTYFIK